MTGLNWSDIKAGVSRFQKGEEPARTAVQNPLGQSRAARNLECLADYIDYSLPAWDNADAPMPDEDLRPNHLCYRGGGLTTRISFEGNSLHGFFVEEHVTSGPATVKGVRFSRDRVYCLEFNQDSKGVRGLLTTYDRKRPGWNQVEEVDLAWLKK